MPAEFLVKGCEKVGFCFAERKEGSDMKSEAPQYLSPLCGVCNSIVSTLHLPELLSTITRTAVEVLEVKASSLRLLDKRARTLEMAAVYGLSEEYLKKGSVEVEWRGAPLTKRC